MPDPIRYNLSELYDCGWPLTARVCDELKNVCHTVRSGAAVVIVCTETHEMMWREDTPPRRTGTVALSAEHFMFQSRIKHVFYYPLLRRDWCAASPHGKPTHVALRRQTSCLAYNQKTTLHV